MKTRLTRLALAAAGLALKTILFVFFKDSTIR